MDAPEVQEWKRAHGGLVVPNPKGYGFTTVKVPGHRAAFDGYRAACVPAPLGCRQCGAIPTGRAAFYCSDAHRTQFVADHFWGDARRVAILRASVFAVDDGRWSYKRPVAVLCQRCWEPITKPDGGWWASESGIEVNHIVPVNGVRENFGCSNHQTNLEALCHPCHIVTTAEQRQAGLIGRARLVTA